MKNFNQNTKSKPHWHFSVFLKIWYFISSSFWSFQTAFFKTKRRCFGALKVAALYEHVNKVTSQNSAWLCSHSGTEQWSEAEAQMVVVRSCNVFSQETPDVCCVKNGPPWTDTHIAILTSQDVMTTANMLVKINNLSCVTVPAESSPEVGWYSYSWE